MGRAPCTREALPDFHKWCRATRHPLLFRGLTGCQRTPGFGASQFVTQSALRKENIEEKGKGRKIEEKKGLNLIN